MVLPATFPTIAAGALKAAVGIARSTTCDGTMAGRQEFKEGNGSWRLSLVVAGTDWPIFALLHSYDWSYPGIPRGNDYDCVQTNRNTLDWPQLLSVLQDGRHRVAEVGRNVQEGASFLGGSLQNS
eukprot:s49_g87.t1